MRSNCIKAFILALLLMGLGSNQSNAGSIIRYFYDNITGTAVADLYNATNAAGQKIFPNGPNNDGSPLQTEVETVYFESPNPGTNNGANNFGSMMEGFIEPPVTGNYVFYLASDDSSELFLSTDGNPANKVSIATAGSTGWRTWTGGSAAKPLVRGQRYYIQVAHKEGTATDYVSVGWKIPASTNAEVYALQPGDALQSDGSVMQRPILTKFVQSSANSFYADPQILQQPVDVTVTEGATASFDISLNASQPSTYQWYKGVAPVAGETLSSLNIKAKITDSGRYSVVVTTPKGVAVSRAAQLTVTRDTTPPTLTSASTALADPYTVKVQFSEPVNPANAGDIANYSLDNGIQVYGVTIDSPTAVTLFTSVLALNKSYILTVVNIRDMAAIPNVMIAGQTTFTVPLPIAFKIYTGISGGNRNVFEGSTIHPKIRDDKYDRVVIVTALENNNGGFGENYAGRIQAYLVPPLTGNYVFASATDDGGGLYLSTDENPANKTFVCGHQSNWQAKRAYGDYKSAAIPLVAGKRYYVEAIIKNAGGGDNMAATWQKPGDPAIVNGQLPISGEYLQAYDTSGITFTIGPVFFKQDLPAFTQVVEGDGFTLSVSNDGTPPYSYQWYRNGVPIPGATGSSYSVSRTVWADNHSWFTVMAKNNFSMAASTSCELRLSDDVTPPAPVAAYNFFTNIVTVEFSETITAELGNFVLKNSLGTVIPIQSAAPGGDSAIDLTLAAPLDTLGLYTLEVSGVKDQSHLVNTMPAMKAVAVLGFNAQIVTIGSATNQPSSAGLPKISFLSGGSDIWDVADGFTFGAQQVTGNFDFMVRIESINLADNWTKAGIMIRETLAAGSRQIHNFGTSSSGQNALQVNYRPVANAASSGTGNITPLSYPNVYLRMQRFGNIVAAYYSTDGATWNQYVVLDTATFAGGAFTNTCYVGLALTSHNTSQTATAMFGRFGWAATQLTIANQPQNATANEGYTATFNVTMAPVGYYSYQWQKNQVDIPGATNSTLVTAPVKRASNGAKYRVIITNQGKTYTSSEATLTVINDDTLPVYLGGGVLYGSQVFVMQFSEPMDPVTVGPLSNYKVTGAGPRPPKTAVPKDNFVLVTMQQAISSELVVAVNGITDYGDHPYDGTNTIPLVRMTAKDIGTINANGVMTDPAMAGATYPVSSNAFAVVAGGSDIWSNADGFHYTYTDIAGDFDVRVRVESLKNSDNNAKAGLMIREFLTGGSRNLSTVVSPLAPAANKWSCNYRAASNGVTAGWPSASSPGPVTYPNAWIRLLRDGNTFTSMRSTNGTTWEVLGTITPNPPYPSGGNKVYVGLGTCSHNNTSNAANQTIAWYRDFQIKSYTALKVVSLVGGLDFNKATLTLSTPVTEASATNLANYSFDNGLTITKATLDSTGTKVVFDTAVQGPGVLYTLTINNVGNNDGLVLKNTKATFTAWILSQGFLTRQVWYNTTKPLTNLLASSKYPNSPDEVSYLNTFEAPSNVADNYSQKVFGWINPPVTGNYVFYIASDADSQLFLSTNEATTSKTMIAEVPAGDYADVRQWQNGRNNAKQKSAAIALEAGKLYYIEALMAAGTNKDSLAVTWTLPGDSTVPANGSLPIGGEYLNTWMNPDGVNLTIIAQPASVTIPQNSRATFPVGVSYGGSLIGYQWQKLPPGGGNWQDIAGANSATYQTPRLAVADSGTQYRLLVFAPGKSLTSAAATATVIVDTAFPLVDKIGALFGANLMAVRFSEEVDPASATNLHNYIVYAGVDVLPIVSATMRPDGMTVILKIDQAITNRVVLWIEQIKDINGNLLAGMFRSSDVIMMFNKDLGTAGVDPLVAGATYGVSSSELELVAGGSDIGGTSDGAQFAYKQVAGDFDIKARVDSLSQSDPASKAGLMVREDLDGNSRELSIVVTPAGGLNNFQVISRDTKGGATATLFSGGTPAYPNAWVRLQRVGTTITAYYGVDGVNWTTAAAYTASPVFPVNSYIGIAASAHKNTAGSAISAQFRGLQIAASSLAPLAPSMASLKIKAVGNSIVISWPDDGESHLESGTAAGIWSDVVAPVSTDGDLNYVTLPTDAANRLYRLSK